MPNAGVLDRFDQFAVLSCAFTASAGAFVKTRLETGITTLQKIAWVVSRIEYEVSPGVLSYIIDALDHVDWIITASASELEAVNFTSPSIYDKMGFVTRVVSAAALTFRECRPTVFVKQFPPGHEMLMLPQCLYLGLSWVTAAALATTKYVRARVWYKELELGPADWYDLLQLRLPLGTT